METIIERIAAPGAAFTDGSSINYRLILIKQYQEKIKSLSAKVAQLIALCSISENKSRLQLIQKQLTFLYIKLNMAASDLLDLNGTCFTADNEGTSQELSRIEGVMNEFLQFFKSASIALQKLTRVVKASEKLRSILLY